ncbi:MAG: response regulator [Anaerolineales bacterium]
MTAEPTPGTPGTQTGHAVLDAATYRELFELAPNPRLVIDGSGTTLLVNQAFSNQLGYARQDWIEQSTNWDRLFEEPGLAQDLLSELIERKVIRNREVRIFGIDGAPITMLLSGSLIELDQQPAVEVTLLDITRQRHYQRALYRDHARLNSLLEGLTAGLFLVNQRGLVTEVNRMLFNLLEIEQESVSGASYKQLFGRLIEMCIEPEVVQHTLSEAVLAVSERPVVEVVLDREPPVHLELAFFPVWDDHGVPIGWGGLVTDVSEMRDSVSWKLELLSILAHDIRAPLATLKGHATALLANFRQWDDSLMEEFLSAIDRSTDQLIHQVERSLALTRVEAGRLGLRPEAVDPAALVHDVIERISGFLGQIELQLDIPEDLPKVRVDSSRMEEVLINLIENAVRYNPSDKPIILSAARTDSLLQLAVTDEGPGVPPEKQEEIFKKFARDEVEGGSGLGLFISRRIVEAHGGQIWVESPPEGASRGARFVLTIPIMPEQAQEEEPASEARPLSQMEPGSGSSDGLKLLVVEDESDFQALLRSVLLEAGYGVEIVPDGQSALDLIQTSQPDLVLLDWMLPGMDGLSVCRNLRRWSNIPVLMVTSRNSQQDLIAALDAGADDYIVKPFQTPELLARIRAVLRRRETWAERDTDQFSAGGLMIHFDAQEVWSHGQRIDLTPTEYSLLAYLAQNQGRVLTYDQLLDHLYEADQERSRHDLFVHISRLRKKIEPDPEEPRYILTRWGVGYLFES